MSQEQYNGQSIPTQAITHALIESRIVREEESLKDFVDQANTQIAARQGRIGMLNELLEPDPQQQIIDVQPSSPPLPTPTEKVA